MVKEPCRHFCNWFSQILIIAAIILLIFFPFTFPLFFIAYILYIVTCFCSPTYSYLSFISKTNSIHDKMKSLFQKAPTFYLYTNSFHINKVRTRVKSGKSYKYKTVSVKKVTLRDKEEFKYSSWRDISGIFLLNSEEMLSNIKRIFIKLELDLSVDFADDITSLDYNKQKQNMIERNRPRDRCIEFWDEMKVENFQKLNMVKLGDQNICCLSQKWFLLFTFIIPVMQIYKYYVQKHCIAQKFSIKKIVSSRYNLHDEEANKKYEENIPKIKIYDENEINYNEAPVDFNQIHDFPSEEELAESEKFGSKNKRNTFKFGEDNGNNMNNLQNENEEDDENNNDNPEDKDEMNPENLDGKDNKLDVNQVNLEGKEN